VLSNAYSSIKLSINSFLYGEHLMGNLICRTRENHMVQYSYQNSVPESQKTFLPVLETLKHLESEKILPTQVSQTPMPRILTIACGFAEDVPLYRQTFGEHCSIEAIDVNQKFSHIKNQETRLAHDTHFTLGDARHLPYEPNFDLLALRHPEPSSAKKMWMEIFVEAALFAQKSQAALLLTTFSRHERDYFIEISAMMGNARGVSLVKDYVNTASEPQRDDHDVEFGRDRFVAIFKPL